MENNTATAATMLKPLTFWLEVWFSNYLTKGFSYCENMKSSHVKINMTCSHVKITTTSHKVSSLAVLQLNEPKLFYFYMIETSLKIARIYLATFRKLWKSSGIIGNFRKMIGKVNILASDSLRRILKNLRKSSAWILAQSSISEKKKSNKIERWHSILFGNRTEKQNFEFDFVSWPNKIVLNRSI